MQAAVLGIKLSTWIPGRRARQRNASISSRRVQRAGSEPSAYQLPRADRAGARHIWNQYVILAPRRDAARNFSGSGGIGTEIYYPVPLHRQPCFAYLGYPEATFRIPERAAMRALALPIYPELQPAAAAVCGRSVAALLRWQPALLLKSSGTSWWRPSSL